MQSYICDSHKAKIKFVCFNSQWHCDFLCEECIPIHNNSHLQNKTPLNLQSLEELYDDSFRKVEKMTDFLIKNGKYLENSQTKVEKYNFTDNFEIKRLLECKAHILKKVEDFFNSYINKLKNNITVQRDNMAEKIKNSCLENADLLQECRNLISKINENKIENIKNLIKFSRKNEQLNTDEKIYNSEETDILSEISDKTVIIDNKKISDFDDLLQKVIFIDKSKIFLAKKKEKIQKKDLQKCKLCGGYMKYISDFKKHLTCEGCSSVKRLYG